MVRREGSCSEAHERAADGEEVGRDEPNEDGDQAIEICLSLEFRWERGG